MEKHDAERWLRAGDEGRLNWNQARTAGDAIPQLDGIELPGVDLSGFDLDRVRLGGANLRGAKFDKTDLTMARLPRAKLAGASFRKARMSRINLSDADLERTSFRGAELNGGVLGGANLRGANLSRADLSSAFMSAAELDGAELQGACLDRADLFGATLTGCQLEGASLVRAKLTDANLAGSDLRNADLSGASISRCDLSGTDLRGVITKTHTGEKRGLATLLAYGNIGLRFDETKFKGARFSPDLEEPWSILKRFYQPGRLPLLALLLAVAWLTGVCRSIVPTSKVLNQPSVVSRPRSEPEPAKPETAATELAKTEPAATEPVEPEPSSPESVGAEVSRVVAPTVIARPRFFWWKTLLGLMLLADFWARYRLNTRVVLWKEQELTSGYTPAWADYRHTWASHRLLSVTLPAVLILALVLAFA